MHRQLTTEPAPPAGAEALARSYPLSPMQQGMLFHHLLSPGSGVDIEQMVCWLPEPIDAAVLRAAWEKVVARHAILRTSFRWEGLEQPMQEVHREVKLSFLEEDWRAMPADEQYEKLSTFIEADRVRGIAMDEAPMLRLALFRRAEDRYVLVWTFHHALLDGRSFPIVLNEVFLFYEARLRGESINPPLPREYRDYINWLQQLDMAKAQAFWRGVLKGFRATTPVVVDQKLRIAPGESRQGDQEVLLSAATTAALLQLSHEQGFTLNTLVQGAWALLLHRYSGEDDVVFGATRACRRSAVEGADSMVGLFINTLPVRAKIDPAKPLLPWLRELRAQWVAMRDFEHTPLVKVQTWSEVPPGMPLFDSIVVFENFLLPAALRAQGGAWARRNFRLYEQTSFPITLAVYSGAELCLKFEFDRSRFDHATIQRMLGHLKTLLDGMVANPASKLGELPMLTAEERHELLVEWNQSNAKFAPDHNLHQLFEAQAARTPEAVAVTCEEARLTYRELNERANQLAHLLRSCGVRPDVICGICIDRSLEMVVGILGILKAGGAYLPIDLSYPKDRLAFMLEDAKAPVLLTQKKLVSDLPAHQAKVICLDDPQQAALSSQPLTNPENQITPANLAYVIFTSGSTGKPKGCAITHQNVVRLMQATDHWYRFNERDVWTLFHSYAFDFSVWEIWGALLYGGRLVVVPFLVSRSPEAFYEMLANEKVTVLNQTPSAFRQLIQVEETSAAPRELALRYVIFGGEALEMQSLKPWFERHGDQRPQLVNMYGITETTVHVTYRPLKANDVPAASVIGVPLPDLQIYILDQRRQPVPIGVPGEMFVGGAGLARGYLNRPELTADRFIPNPFSDEPGARLYKTGDLARFLPGRDIEYLGRIDHQVKIRGFRIELGEIESVLCTHPTVREAVVLAREDGPGGKRLVAYLTTKNGAKPSVAELREHLKVKMPEYMVPAAFVLLDQLPLTNNGKVDRKALPAPELNRLDAGANYVAPRTDAETTLVEIWKHVLRVERVGVQDNFFELGGDSILTIHIIARARKAGLALTPKQLFQTPTIAELAAVAQTKAAVQSEQGLVRGSAPLTPIQHWFFEQDLREAHHYNQAFLFTLRERLDEKLLAKAVEKLVQHHDALRLRFTHSDAGWRQDFSEPGGTTPFEKRDFSTLAPAEQTKAVEEASAQFQATLNTANGPLLRVVYFDLGAEAGRLLVVVHHLAVDGVSWRTLMEDLETVYGQLRAGQAVQLPAKTASFKQWAEQLVKFAKSPALQSELDFWHGVSAVATPKLPCDFSATENTEASTSTLVVSLDAAETRSLLQEVPAAYNTQINDVLFTALAQSFAGWTGGRSLLIDLEGHGREEICEALDLSRSVGWFTSVFPVRLELPVAGDAGAALKSVKEQLRRIPQRGIGYGVLRYLCGDVALQAQPQAEVVFNYLGQFDQVLSGLKLFGFAPENSGPWHSPQATRRQWLEINSLVVNDRLELRWTFSRNAHRAETIQRVAENFLAALREIIAHCLAPDAGGYTPSDFPLAQLDQTTLDRITAGLPEVEDLLPLSPMQQLFYTLQSVRPDVGFHQYHYTLHGPLDVPALRAAWERVLARHAILRTGYISEGLKSPAQVVHRRVAFPWLVEDWRGLSGAAQEQKFTEFLRHDHARGFDLAQPPLMRCSLLRLADEVYRVVWCHHHLDVDGWSWPLILKEVSHYYLAEVGQTSLVPAPAKPFRDYVAWLARRGVADDEEFWREALRGFSEPTPLPQTAAGKGGSRFVEETVHISQAAADELREFARTHQLTLSTLAQAAWALLLSRQSGRDEVVFGAAFSGRPAELGGVETMVGSFVNDLPVRMRVPAEARVADWLNGLQAAQAQLGLHQFTSPLQIQAWSEVPWRFRLFESLVVFQNYVMEEAVTRLCERVTIRDLAVPIRTTFPLTLVVVPSEGLDFTLIFDTRTLDAGSAGILLGELAVILRGIAGRPAQMVGELLDQLRPAFARPAITGLKLAGGSQNFVAPQTELEKQIAKIWQEAFGRERVGTADNFFDLGGHSLLMIQVHARLCAALGREISIVRMFQYPTVGALAKFLGLAPGEQSFEKVQNRAQLQRAALARQRTANRRSS